MILYNIRANGPYEYDKFVLNYGQLYNLIADTQDLWEQSPVQMQNTILSEQIADITQAWQKETPGAQNNILAELVLLNEIMMEP